MNGTAVLSKALVVAVVSILSGQRMTEWAVLQAMRVLLVSAMYAYKR